MKFLGRPQAWCLFTSLAALSAAAPLDDAANFSLVSASGSPTSLAGQPTSPPKVDGPTFWKDPSAVTVYVSGCSKDQQDAVQKAWNEAYEIVNAQQDWADDPAMKNLPPTATGTPVAKWQESMTMYMGNTTSDPNAGGLNLWTAKSGVAVAVDTQAAIYKADNHLSPVWKYAYIYCDESKVPLKDNAPSIGECDKPSDPSRNVTAYAFAGDGTEYAWKANYIVLCPRFFDDDILTLSDMTAQAKQSQNDNVFFSMNTWRMVKARVMLHMTYHWTINWGAATQAEVSDPAQVVQLATDGNYDATQYNTESWTQAALAVYVQKTFSAPGPPVPGVTDLTDNFDEKWLTQAPDSFNPPVPWDADKFSPDMSNAVQLQGV